MKAFVLKALASLCVLGSQNNVEVTSGLGLNKTIKSSDLIIDYQFIQYQNGSYYLVNPRLHADKSGMFSGGLGLGVRKDFGKAYAGVHVFGDYSYFYGSQHFQVGPCFEYIHPKWDFTLNYYHPISKSQILDESMVKGVNHIDGNIFYKMRYADIGIEPSYNIRSNEFGAVAHIAIPTVFGNIKLSAGRNSRHGDHAKIGISMPIYGAICSTHNPKVRRHIGIVHEIKEIVKPVIIEEPVIVVPEEEEEKSWWDVLFGWMVSDEPYSEDNQGLWATSDWSYPDSDYNYNYSTAPSTAVGAASNSPSSSQASDLFDNSPGTPPALIDHSHGYAAELDSPASHSSDSSIDTPPGSAAEMAALSESAFIENMSNMLASDPTFTITVDSVDENIGLANIDIGDALLDTPPNGSSNGSESSDGSASSYDIVGQNSPYSQN